MTETFATGLPSVSRAIFDFIVTRNSLTTDGVDWDVLINNVFIGSFTIALGQTGPVHLEFIFNEIAGPNYTVRFEVVNEIISGGGSHDLGYAGSDAGTVELLPLLDHFKCWQVKDLKNPKFSKIEDLPLDDQFAIEDVDVKKPFLICAPADKDGSGIVDSNTHQCCYKIKASKLEPPENVEITDQFGTLQLEVKKAKFLCQPCTKIVLP